MVTEFLLLSAFYHGLRTQTLHNGGAKLECTTSQGGGILECTTYLKFCMLLNIICSHAVENELSLVGDSNNVVACRMS